MKKLGYVASSEGHGMGCVARGNNSLKEVVVPAGNIKNLEEDNNNNNNNCGGNE